MKILVYLGMLNKQLIIGLLAVAPLLGPIYTSFSKNQDSSELVKDIEDQEQDSASSETYQISYEAVVPLLKAGMAPLVFFVIELNLINEIDYSYVVDANADFNSFFRILFRLIISPNGP